MPGARTGHCGQMESLPNSNVKQSKRSVDHIFSSATDSFTMERRTLLPLRQLPDVSNRSAQCDTKHA